MLKFYMGTIIFYAIIILATMVITKSKIIENGWMDGVEKSKTGKWTMLFCVSAVPFFRLLFVILMFYMVVAKKGDVKNDK